MTSQESRLGIGSDHGRSVRTKLLAEGLAFTRALSRLSGITRIALLGSLTTPKADPKDLDLLVTVADDVELATLASLARRLAGHVQSFNHGADVFLADPRGNYLGRACLWKECRFGVRLRCDAQHCGRRPYLHDDLETIRLPRHLVATPPIELWPRIVARVEVPEDVQRELLAKLEPGRS